MPAWTKENPGECDLDSLRSTCSDLLAINDQLIAADSEVQNSRDALGTWTGASAEAFVQTHDTFHAAMASLAGAIEGSRTAINTYADAVEDIQTRARQYRSARDDAQQRCDAADRVLNSRDENWQEPISDEEAQRFETARLNKECASADLNSAITSLAQLSEERTLTDSQCSTALSQQAFPSDWVTVGTDMKNVGYTRPSDLNLEAIVDEMERLSDAAFDEDGLTESERAALQEFLDLWGGDEGIMDAYYTRVGAGYVAALLDQIGYLAESSDDATAAYNTALSLQSGLAVASAHWTTQESETFAAELMDSPNCANAISFLFGNWENCSMGQNLAVAMANSIDEFEREFGQTAWNNHDTGAGYLTTLMYAADPKRGNDPGGAVMGSLANHPDAALDWLSDDDDTVGSERITYWFEKRSSELPADGFAGVGALFESIYHIENGLDYPDSLDMDRLKTWAESTSSIVDALYHNPTYKTSSISQSGSLHLANAYAALLPLWADIPLHDGALAGTDGGYQQAPVPGTTTYFNEIFGQDIPYPNVDLYSLATLLGVATSEPAGAFAWNAGVSCFVETIIESVDPNDPDYYYKYETSLEEIGAVQGLTVGTGVAQGILEDLNAALDEKTYWDAVFALNSYVPKNTPKIAASFAKPGWAAAVTFATSTLQGAVTPDPLATLRQSITDSMNAQDDRTQEAIDSMNSVVNVIVERHEAATGETLPEEKTRGLVASGVGAYNSSVGMQSRYGYENEYAKK